jgi:hypothetical protein
MEYFLFWSHRIFWKRFSETKGFSKTVGESKQFRRPGSSARLSEVEILTKSILRILIAERILIALKKSCHRRNADLFFKTICVSLAFPSKSQFEPKVSLFTYGPLYCPDPFASKKPTLPIILKFNKKWGLFLAPERTYEKIFIQIEWKFDHFFALRKQRFSHKVLSGVRTL